MNRPSFFAELKRRNVYKVAVAYAAVGWLVIQVATSTFPVLQIPAWAMRLAQPDSAEAQMYLGFAEAGLGNEEIAVRAAKIAIALRPVSMDAVAGAAFEEALARIEAHFGRNDLAIADLERLVKTNYLGPEQIPLTPGLLRLDPAWNSLRNDPRFEKILASVAPK